MRVRNVLAVIFMLVMTACSKINEENFSRIQSGMAEKEVFALLGNATETNSVGLLGVSGTNARWVSGDAVITIQFVNGKVAVKSFDKPAAKN